MPIFLLFFRQKVINSNKETPFTYSEYLPIRWRHS